MLADDTMRALSASSIISCLKPFDTKRLERNVADHEKNIDSSRFEKTVHG